MDFILALLEDSVCRVFLSVLHNWPFLLASILIAAVLKLYVDAGKVAGFLRRFKRSGVTAATTAAVATPLCSCGTTAVVLGMMASTMPWAPIVAFMVASPLSSPEGFFYTAGLFGWPFAIAMVAGSAVLGLAGGAAASVLENRGWLRNQARMAVRAPVASFSAADVRAPVIRAPRSAPTLTFAMADGCGNGCSTVSSQALPACGCGTGAAVAPSACGCGSPASDAAPAPVRFDIVKLLNAIVDIAKRLVPMFLGFAFIGYFINGLIPSSWVSAIFGEGRVYGVPLAATLGLPLYLNAEASLPLVRSLLDAGMSQGAAMAFLITGAGTSIGAIVGALTIARWRVVGLVVGVLWVGAMAAGFAFDLLRGMGAF